MWGGLQTCQVAAALSRGIGRIENQPQVAGIFVVLADFDFGDLCARAGLHAELREPRREQQALDSQPNHNAPEKQQAEVHKGLHLAGVNILALACLKPVKSALGDKCHQEYA